MINDTDSFQKLISGNGKYLKQLFGNYVNGEYVQDVLISYRDKDQACYFVKDVSLNYF